MKTMPRVVVAHQDKQHSFMTACAVKDAEMLDKYITSVYDKKGSLTHFLTHFLRGAYKKKLMGHRCMLLPDEDVLQYCEFLTLSLFILSRIDRSRRLYDFVKKLRDKRFCKKVASYCEREKVDALISYDTLSGYAYDILTKDNSPCKRILDVSAPFFSYMRDIFALEAEKNPILAKELQSKGSLWLTEQSSIEIRTSDAFLVASDFTKKSLISSGAAEKNIYKCVYGTDISFFNTEGRKDRVGGKLRVVYVGNVTPKKGSGYLLEVIKKSNRCRCDFDFTLVGAYDAEDITVKELKGLCTLTGHIQKDALKQVLLSSDVMVFPSLADGFGQAVLEAMACGVVPVCSENAGASSIIKDGENGFVVKAFDSDAIFEKLVYLSENRSVLDELCKSAAAAAKEYTYERYASSVKDALYGVLSDIEVC